MPKAKPKIIGIISSKLAYDLANQLYNEFESRWKEATYLIENYSYYKLLKTNLRTVEILLALSIFHKRVLTNLDAIVKFQATVERHSEASVISIGGYDLDRQERNRILAIQINYNELRNQFGLNNIVFEYYETKELLRQIVNYKKNFEEN